MHNMKDGLVVSSSGPVKDAVIQSKQKAARSDHLPALAQRCEMPELRHQAHKELYAYKQVIQKEKVKELNLHEICAVCLEEFKQKDELGICPCKHAFHRKCLIKWLEVRKVCPLCNMPVLQLAQQQSTSGPIPPMQQPLPGVENLV
ncbi:hypothetical protein DNTS_018285 [Danionella cerebrum]|uniref:RING-type domain-containing protein n=1 Tax=Danionella cerebrum TaxID=2873325 RepID=A0A553RK45_9TELE|nr:hypothetical protein DNTS_018285 [Danionella translucida]